ncbi:hypothetical protein N7505_001276 [Penicillium chrysogenum]|uniref:Uncharacterized protein n=1 Tax=Penicillium chrysogenum TaxID=5076 RepID=A0ABQ8WX72_PENCH|nr:hypothetical protein N7505_001276 [Penicillium chrysogenum]
MDHTRLIQCQGNDLAYIKHLELRIIELESACSSRYPESSGIQQQTSGQYRPCEACRDLNLSTQDVGASQEISADSIRLDSESCHDNQSSQHNNRPPGSTFPFIPYEPPVTTNSPVTTDSSALTDSAKQQWNRLDSFASSLSDIPETSHWKMWTSTSEDRRKDIVLSLVSGLAFPNGDNPIAHELPAPISILLEYSKSMEPAEPKCASAKSEGKRPFTYFQELIFCSMCAVALEFTPQEVVFEVMKSVFQSDAKSKTLRARIHGAKWANRAIYHLSRTEWGSRSWDLIYAGYELRHYNELDLSGLEKLLVVPANTDPNDTDPTNTEPTNTEPTNTEPTNTEPTNTEPTNTEPTNTEPTNTEPNDAGPSDDGPNDTRPNKKRKNGPPETSSKRRCRDVSSGSPEGDYFETLNGSHLSIHAIPTPSAPGSCSDSVIDGLFEEFPTSTSGPTEGLLGLDANEEMVGSRVGYANSSPLTSNHSAQQSILPQSHVDLLFHRGDNIPDTALLRDARSRTSAAVTIPDFELETRADQLSTTNLCFAMNGTLDLESNSSSNIATSSASTTLSQTFSPDNIAQQQGSKSGLCNLQVDTVHTDSEESHSRIGQIYSKNVYCNSGCEPHEYRNEHVSHTRPSPPSTDWPQQYGWEIDDILQQGLAANNSQLPPSTDWLQQYGWEIDDILQQGLAANNPQLPPSTDCLQQYGWEIDDILQQGLAANNSQLPPSTDWLQQYGWEIDDILQQGLPANNPQPPSTSWWEQCTSDLLQQDLSLSSHSPLPSLGSGQEAATAISGNSPETLYHLLFRSSLVSREGNSSWDLENSHHALGFSDPIHQNASYSPNRSLSVM